MSALFNRLTAKSPASVVDFVLITVIYFLGYLFFFPLILALIELVYPGFLTLPYTDVIFHTIMTLVFLFLGRRYLQEKGSGWSLGTLWTISQGFMAMMFGSMALNILISTLTGLETSLNQKALTDLFLQNPLAITVQAAIFAPIAEEVVFRGALYRHFRKEQRFWVPLLVSSILFGSMHALVSIISGAWTDLWFVPVYVYMGLVLAVVYERTHSLYAAVTVHFLNNAISIYVMYALLG